MVVGVACRMGMVVQIREVQRMLVAVVSPSPNRRYLGVNPSRRCLFPDFPPLLDPVRDQ